MNKISKCMHFPQLQDLQCLMLGGHACSLTFLSVLSRHPMKLQRHFVIDCEAIASLTHIRSYAIYLHYKCESSLVWDKIAFSIWVWIFGQVLGGLGGGVSNGMPVDSWLLLDPRSILPVEVSLV